MSWAQKAWEGCFFSRPCHQAQIINALYNMAVMKDTEKA